VPRLRITVTAAIAFLTAAGAAVLAPLFAQGPSPATGDEAAIKEVVRKYVEAREAREPKAIEPLLTADADQLVSDGTWRRGRDALVRGMLESSKRTGGRRNIIVESVRMLSTDVALADGRYTQTGLAGGREREMWTTIILKRGPDGWRIAAIRNMLPTAPAPPAKGQLREEKQGPHAVRYEAEERLPEDREAEKRRDYAVLEAALDDLTSPMNPEYRYQIRNIGPRREIVIDDNTWEHAPRDPGEESRNIDHKDPRPIPDDIRSDLRRRDDGPSTSLADFRPANPDIVVRDLDELFGRADGPLSAIAAFDERHPDAWGYVSAHLPGYSNDGDRAVIVFEGGPSAHGLDWVYMLTRRGKRWEIQWRHLHPRG
jgi:uncharacterized protein (TIGR02246 family)